MRSLLVGYSRRDRLSSFRCGLVIISSLALLYSPAYGRPLDEDSDVHRSKSNLSAALRREWFVSSEPAQYSVPLLTCPHAAPEKAPTKSLDRAGFFEDDVEKAAKGRFRVFRIIGEGKHGVVALAEDKTTGEMVAIKKDDQKSLAGEAALLQLASSSESVVNFKGVVPVPTDSDTGYLVLEKMDGEIQEISDLWGGLKHVPPADMKRILLNVVLAVHALHSNNMVHLDIKKENVMFRKNLCKIKIVDMGCGHTLNARTGEASIQARTANSGNHPPEWSNRRSSVAKYIKLTWDQAIATDIWSLGGTLLAVLVRGDPYSQYTKASNIKYKHWMELLSDMFGQPTLSVVKKHYSEEAHDILKSKSSKRGLSLKKAFPFVDSHALELVESIMQMDPRKRPSTWEILKHPYFADVLHSADYKAAEPQVAYAAHVRVEDIIANKHLYAPSTVAERINLYQELAAVEGPPSGVYAGMLLEL